MPYRFIGFLRCADGTRCTGSLISDRHVLTAGANLKLSRLESMRIGAEMECNVALWLFTPDRAASNTMAHARQLHGSWLLCWSAGHCVFDYRGTHQVRDPHPRFWPALNNNQSQITPPQVPADSGYSTLAAICHICKALAGLM